MGRELDDERVLVAQAFDSQSTGYQGEQLNKAAFPIQGTGMYQLGADLEGNGRITQIDRESASNCTVTLDNKAKLNFCSDHIVKIECPNGSTYELKHDDEGGLSEVKMLNGEILKHKDGHWYTEDGKKTDRQFDMKKVGTLLEWSSKDENVGTYHYPNGTSISGRIFHLKDRSNTAITKVERFGHMLAECGHDDEGYYNRIKLQSGEEWKKQGPMLWKSNSGDVYEGTFYFEDGRHLRRRDIHGNRDSFYKPF